MKTSLLSLFLSLSLSVGLAQATAPGAEHFFQTPQLSHVALSPKGGYVASVTATPNGVSLLSVRNTSDLSQYKIIIRTTDQEVITAVHWINENRIGFTIKNLRVEFDGNLDEIAADRDGSNVVHLISGNWTHQRENTGSSIKAHTLTADYEFYGVTHDGSDDILVQKFSWNNIDRTPDHSRIYRLNTRNRQLRGALEGAQPGAVQWWMTDTYDVPRVVMSQKNGRCISSYRRANDTEWRELENGGCYLDSRFSPAFFDGDDTLYVNAGHKGYIALFRYDLQAMKMDKQPFISVPGFDFNGVPEIDYTSHRLLGIHLQTDAGTTYWLNPAMKAEQAKVDAMLPNTTNTIHCADDCLQAPVALVVTSSDRQPPQYIIYHRASGKLEGLGAEHPDIQVEQMGLRDFHHYKARDGRSIPAYVTLPPGKASGPLPAVVLVHGGPTVRGAYWAWDSEAQFLASRGYVVIQPEFRGGTGFGSDHFKAGLKQWGLTMQDDLADAAQWAVQQGWADPKRIGIMGASYGGYATLMGLIKHSEIFRCGVEWAGVTDIGLRFDTPYSDASQETLNYSLRTLIGDPDKDTELWRKSSPLARAAELKQPLLIAHGVEDVRVPIVHANRFYDAVKRGNSNVEMITYPNEGHGWRHEDNRIAFWQRVDAFLEKNLKQAP
ncbi:prolyl oligopeptidase family serine peptidase [Duganella sp. CY15W]|uniref:alpha/beta hydrolase family protein n=1 Tax=Duganella sp. CY15W TaxID=2692172 RepID=UPI00136EB527|nr:S9 family peptidase [Duganella sp. CY15W]MYM32598.1 prolyl oligopeptidase family serine peptidase [Duganella sp. CY15W]